jgi:hypothetical protein
VNVKQLREALADWPDETSVAVRTIETGEVCLTVDLTGVDQYADGSLLLVGDLDHTANWARRPRS